MSKIDLKECVLWTGAGSNPSIKRTQKCGLIRRYDPHRGNTISKTPARYFYEKEHGPLKPGMEVAHLCGIHLCINVKHIIAGTRGAMFRLAYEDGRRKKPKQTHCQRGHPFTEENTYLEKQRECENYRRRTCRTCAKARHRNTYEKHRGPLKPKKYGVAYPPMHNENERCRSGHYYTEENTIVKRDYRARRWSRYCRSCTNKSARLRHRRIHKTTIAARYRGEWDETFGGIIK